MSEHTESVEAVLAALEEAKNQRIRDEAALDAIQREEQRLLVEVLQEFGCHSLAELQTLIQQSQQELTAVLSQARSLLAGGEVF